MDNKLEAYINIDPPLYGGNPPTLKEIMSALENNHITQGVNAAKLRVLAVNPIYNRNLVVAQGIAPINGESGSYTFHFRDKKDLKPKERKDGTIDYHDLGIVENVSKGQLLCSIVLPTDGTPGMSVTGVTLPPVRGIPVSPMNGKYTELNETGTAIYSKVNGHVEFDGRMINVSDTFFVNENVDSSTGDVKVAGNVVIKGMVLPGFAVEAGGNIEIRGTVESASLKAGGNILLHSGITGSNLNCIGDLTSRFIENCTIVVHRDVKAEYIMSSEIKCGKSLQLVGMIGKFVGGSCIVGQDIIARNIGSPSGINTCIELGTDPTIIERQQELTKQLPLWNKQISNLQSLITLFRQLEAANRLTPDKRETFDSALYSYETTSELYENGCKEIAEIEKSLENKGFGKITCRETIYPGTMIKIGYSKLLVSDALNNVSLFSQEGEIFQGPAI
jgi:uncharacterized protein (DUF342 family)